MNETPLASAKSTSSLAINKKMTLDDSTKSQTLTLANCGDAVNRRLILLDNESYCRRIWRKDATLWKSDATNLSMIQNSLGWLRIPHKMEESVDHIKLFVQEVLRADFEHVVHMGMGGSSLATLVFTRTFSSKDGLPLTVLDTTDPATINKIEKSIPLEKTLFIVASKSGTTAEPLAFRDYFYERVRLIKGDKAGENFVAITDPKTPLVQQAKDQKFRRIFLNASDIGGRYSALTYFGLVPAALMGVNISEILTRANQSVRSSVFRGEEDDSPALILGAALGEMALQNRNKVTLLIDKEMSALGLWLEQLMAESTGKEERGLIPIADEPVGEPSVYGDDRLFIYLKTKSSKDKILKNAVSALKQAGQPIVTVEISDQFDLGQEFFQWEFATAVAGSILGVNAFDQPNVQESKDNTNKLLSQTKKPMSDEKPRLSEGSLDFYTTLHGISGSSLISQFLKLVFPGDYIALMAFLPEDPGTNKILQTIRRNLRDQLKLATTLGYGPRFLHSTGQLHKGGPVKGLFIQLTADNACDIIIPGKPYTFGKFKQAQAQGDLDALRKRGDRIIRIHLGGQIEKGLKELEALVNFALEPQ